MENLEPYMKDKIRQNRIKDEIKYKILQNELSHKIKELEQEKMVLRALNNYLVNDKILSEKFFTYTDKFKNSITPLKAYVDMLFAGHFGDLNDKQKEKLKIIKERLSTFK